MAARFFPEDFRVKAPLGFNAAVRAAAQRQHITRAEYARRALLRSIEADGVRLRRGDVQIELVSYDAHPVLPSLGKLK